MSTTHITAALPEGTKVKARSDDWTVTLTFTKPNGDEIVLVMEPGGYDDFERFMASDRYENEAIL